MQNAVARNAYDLLEVIIPGGFFTASLFMYYHHPSMSAMHEWTLGALGIFLVSAFAVGHIVQTLSNTIEMYFWRANGGMPTDWIRRGGKRQLLPPNKVTELEKHVRYKLNQGPDFAITGLDGGTWYFMTRQMHAMVVDGRPNQRVQYLEFCYFVNRGLACAVFALSILFLLNDPFGDATALVETNDMTRIYAGAAIFMAGMMTLFRMQRYCVQYALELFAQFMLLPVQRPAPAQTGPISLGKNGVAPGASAEVSP